MSDLDNYIEYIQSKAFEKAKMIASRKEEILEAFIAKYGYEPDEMVMCDQPSTGTFWVEKKNKWINVKDRIPNHNQFFLGYSNTGNMMVLRCDHHYNGSKFINYVFMTPDMKSQVIGITHWMCLPEAPYEKSGNWNNPLDVFAGGVT